MSRSFRKHPMPNMGSEKQDKKYWHGVMRSTEKRNLHTHDFTAEVNLMWCAGCPNCGFTNVWDLGWGDDGYLSYYTEQYNESGKDFQTTQVRDVSDTWSMTKDGKWNCGREGLRTRKMNPRHTPRLVIQDTENYWNTASNWRK